MPNLPSGQPILNLWKQDEAPSGASPSLEATAGAMALDIEGQCPKCSQQMGVAVAVSEDVYYCDNCRVALPLPINE